MPIKAPVVLGFDTSAAQCAAALLSGDRISARADEPMKRGQAERLLPMLEAVLAEAGAGWGDLDGLVVCTGPGNFTGLRLSVAAARGLALALDRPAAGVTRFEALAFGTTGPVFVTIEGPRDQVFAQALVDGVPQDAPVLAPFDDLVAPAGAVCIGWRAPEIAARARGTAEGEATLADPAAVARIGAARLGRGARPAPLYLRPPDAAPAADPAPAILD